MSAKDAKAFFEIVPGPMGRVAKGASRNVRGKIVDIEEALNRGFAVR
jgi:hypothetical protein